MQLLFSDINQVEDVVWFATNELNLITTSARGTEMLTIGGETKNKKNKKLSNHCFFGC